MTTSCTNFALALSSSSISSLSWLSRHLHHGELHGYEEGIQEHEEKDDAGVPERLATGHVPFRAGHTVCDGEQGGGQIQETWPWSNRDTSIDRALELLIRAVAALFQDGEAGALGVGDRHGFGDPGGVEGLNDLPPRKLLAQSGHTSSGGRLMGRRRSNPRRQRAQPSSGFSAM